MLIDGLLRQFAVHSVLIIEEWYVQALDGYIRAQPKDARQKRQGNVGRSASRLRSGARDLTAPVFHWSGPAFTKARAVEGSLRLAYWDSSLARQILVRWCP